MFYKKADLDAGINDEMEHTEGDRALATKIAVDHLLQDKDYYTKLHNAGLEQEGAMTNQERGMTECGADVAIIQVGGNGVGQAPKSGEAAPTKPLTSSNLGGGSPKPLASTGLQAPKGKNTIPALGKTPPKMGGKDSSMGDLNVKGAPISDEEGNEKPNNIEYGKTPPMAGSNSNSDAMDFFGKQISKALHAEVPRRMEQIPSNVYEVSKFPTITTTTKRNPLGLAATNALSESWARDEVNEGGSQLKKKVNNYNGVKVDDAHAVITTDMKGDDRWTIQAFNTKKANKNETPVLKEFNIVPKDQSDGQYHSLLGMDKEKKVASICAWCDKDKTLSNILEKEGWTLTHGLCKKHSDDMRKGLIEQGNPNLKELIFQNNSGAMEIFKFFDVASDEQKNQFDNLIGAGKEQQAWALIEKVLSVKFQGDGPWVPGTA